jgi:hypothetical protein
MHRHWPVLFHCAQYVTARGEPSLLAGSRTPGKQILIEQKISAEVIYVHMQVAYQFVLPLSEIFLIRSSG